MAQINMPNKNASKTYPAAIWSRSGRKPKISTRSQIPEYVIILYMMTSFGGKLAHAQALSSISAQQSYLDKLVQLQNTIEAADADIKNQLYAARADISQLDMTRLKKNVEADTETSNKLNSLAAELIITAVIWPKLEPTEQLHKVADFVSKYGEIGQKLLYTFQDDAAARERITQAGQKLAAANAAAVRLAQLKADRTRLASEGQQAGLLPNISYDAKRDTFTVTSPPRTATPTAQAASSANLPFEGTWAQLPTPSGCQNGGYAYTKTTIRSLFDADDNCRINKIQNVSDSVFSLSLTCKDASGDGPTPTFKSTQTLRMTDPDSMTVEYSAKGAAPNSYKRCPTGTAATASQVQSQPAQAPILNAVVAGDAQALKNSLRSSLPGFSCNANGDELFCQNGQLTLIASIQKKVLLAQSEMTPNPDRFPQAQPLLQTLDRLGEAIGLAPGEVKICRTGSSGQRSRRTNGFISYCTQKTHFTTQIQLGIKPDTSF